MSDILKNPVESPSLYLDRVDETIIDHYETLDFTHSGSVLRNPNQSLARDTNTSNPLHRVSIAKICIMLTAIIATIVISVVVTTVVIKSLNNGKPPDLYSYIRPILLNYPPLLSYYTNLPLFSYFILM